MGIISTETLNDIATSNPTDGNINMNTYILTDLSYGVIGTDSASLG